MITAITTRQDFDEWIAKDKGVELHLFSDNDIIPLYGSIEAFREKQKEFAKRNREIWIENCTNYINTLSQIRFFSDVALYPEYEPDDAESIANELYDNDLSPKQSAQVATKNSFRPQ